MVQPPTAPLDPRLHESRGVRQTRKDPLETVQHTVANPLLSDVGTGSISSWNRSDNADDYEQVIGFLQLGVTVTAILLLSVSAIGMINIGLAGIEQRSHELLIRRALGATRAGIAIQVIGSSVLLSLIIAFAAVLISAVLVWAFPWMMPADSPLEPPAYPYTAAMIAACASIVASLVGSLAPAIKAIRLQPALALRWTRSHSEQARRQLDGRHSDHRLHPVNNPLAGCVSWSRCRNHRMLTISIQIHTIVLRNDVGG